MTAKSAFPPEQLENIAAYLDGELPEEQATEIERTLASNPQARRELQEMIAAWEMLDVLPRIRATEEFTQQTMASIRAEASPAVRDASVWKQRALAVTTWAAVLSCVAVLSYAVASHWGQREYRPVLEQLALLENEPLYREVGSLAFLRAVHDAGLFDDQADQTAQSKFALPWELASPPSTSEPPEQQQPIVLRYAWDEAVRRVQGMTASQREQILASYRRLQEASPEQRQALQELHRAVASDRDLQVTLRRLVAWLRSLEPVERDQIRQAADDQQRLERVRTIRRTERLLALRFTPEDLDRILTLVEKHLPIPEDVRRRFGGGNQSEQVRRLRLLEMVARAMDLRGTPDAATWEEVQKHLPDENVRSLLASEPDVNRRWWALLHAVLMTAAEEVARQHGPLLADTAKLDEFLSQLGPEDRNRILRLPPDEARRELWRRYVMTELQQRPKAEREIWPAVWQANRLAQEIRAIVLGERDRLRWFSGRPFDPRSRNGDRPAFPRGRVFPGNRPRGPRPGEQPFPDAAP